MDVFSHYLMRRGSPETLEKEDDMNLNTIINMVMRTVMRRVVNSGINAGMSAFSSRKKPQGKAPQHPDDVQR